MLISSPAAIRSLASARATEILPSRVRNRKDFACLCSTLANRIRTTASFASNLLAWSCFIIIFEWPWTHFPGTRSPDCCSPRARSAKVLPLGKRLRYFEKNSGRAILSENPICLSLHRPNTPLYRSCITISSSMKEFGSFWVFGLRHFTK